MRILKFCSVSFTQMWSVSAQDQEDNGKSIVP